MEIKDWVTFICAGAGLVAALIAVLPSRARIPSATFAVVLFATAGGIGLATVWKSHDRPQKDTSVISAGEAGEASEADGAGVGATASSEAGWGTRSIGSLQVGDCILGEDLDLDDRESPAPDFTQVVSCRDSHHGEVFLAADPWELGEKS